MARGAQGWMIGWDTNVLLRLVLGDDVDQMRRVKENLSAFSGEGIRIDRIVLVEFVWVLRRVYRLDRAEIAQLLERIMTTPGLEFDTRGAVMIAIRRYRNGPADFADYLIVVLNEMAGATMTYTFDKRAADTPGFAEVE